MLLPLPFYVSSIAVVDTQEGVFLSVRYEGDDFLDRADIAKQVGDDIARWLRGQGIEYIEQRETKPRE